MYRVAVIQNETEMLHYGYANTVSDLRYLQINNNAFKEYSFEMFNIVNIDSLFGQDNNNLTNFDSLLITTNATSDKSVLNKLKENKKNIETFISSGKGIFVSSQKKLSNSQETYTGFLPEQYDFWTQERPKDETDSGEGNISLADPKGYFLLQYPRQVTAETTTNQCKSNRFKKHFYRSYIVPKEIGAYTSIFVDTSYTEKEPKQRNLFLINTIPQNGEKVVLSTIALDWEEHNDLLTNIITYITEGLPKVAIVDKAKKKHGDFDFLLTSIKISKIAHIAYEDFYEINAIQRDIHNTYVFSEDWEEKEVIAYYNELKNDHQNSRKKVYYFKKADGILTLTLYSTFSTFDKIIDRSIAWILNSQPKEIGMWKDGFWITYDILIMLSEINKDISIYIIKAIFGAIKSKHYNEGTDGKNYDGVVAPTCGLLELLFILSKKYPEIDDIFPKSDRMEMLKWVYKKFNSLPNYDQQTVLLTLYQYNDEIVISNKKLYNYEDIYMTVNDKLNRDIDYEPSEIDICRKISLLLIYNNRDAIIYNNRDATTINKYLAKLKDIQTLGMWTNIGRTSYVLIFLLKKIESLEALQKDSQKKIDIKEMIYNGILYLRSEYNWKKSNWKDDIQATAKAIHAIGLYNQKFNYSTSDFYETIEAESEKTFTTVLITELSKNMTTLREHTYKLGEDINLLKLEIKTKDEQIFDRQKKTQESDEMVKSLDKKLYLLKFWAVTLAIMLISVLFYCVPFFKTEYDKRTSFELFGISISLIGLIGGSIWGPYYLAERKGNK